MCRKKAISGEQYLVWIVEVLSEEYLIDVLNIKYSLYVW